MDCNTKQFCDVIYQRSEEHSKAFALMLQNTLYGQAMSILRQELDTLVRLIFLLSHNVNDRAHFIQQTLNGEKWKYPNSRRPITDREMVELSNGLHGWTSYVYKLGCAFIHLSILTYYKGINPFSCLAAEDNLNIKLFLHQYHSFPLDTELNMKTIIPYLDKIFDKVSSHVVYYTDKLCHYENIDNY